MGGFDFCMYRRRWLDQDPASVCRQHRLQGARPGPVRESHGFDAGRILHPASVRLVSYASGLNIDDAFWPLSGSPHPYLFRM